MHHAPEQPAEETCELEPPELDHRGLTPNGGEVTQCADIGMAAVVAGALRAQL